jgi:hypothetical protein
MTLAYLLARWRLLLIFTCIGASTGLAIAWAQEPRYVASMTISSLGMGDAPMQVGISTGGSGVLQALRGISGAGAASLGDGDYAYFISLLNSDRTARKLLRNAAFLKLLFPGEWNSDRQIWSREPTLLSNLSALYNSIFFRRGYIPPDTARVKERLGKVMSVQFDIETSQHVISVRSRSCATSRTILQTVFQDADSVIKSEKSTRYQENIAYLESKIAQPNNVPLREELTSALVLQYMRQISVSSTLPLAARVIDGPGCAPKPALPQPVPYTIVGMLVGLGVAFAYLAFKDARRHD